MMGEYTGELSLSMTKDGGNKELALALMRAESEDDVINVLKERGYWDNNSVWQYYGGSEMNYSTIGAQQSSADSALVEKLINSTDAVMMRECLKRGIEPESSDAPQNIAEAQRIFFGIYEGKMSSIGSRERSLLGENILLAATGSMQNPSLSIIDKGEGHSPKRLPATILSLTKRNKAEVPFVQGKFGMGGSGALRFCCGKKHLMLVISKRNHEIDRKIDEKRFGEDETRDLWGVTIVRREFAKEGKKSSHYSYLAPDNKILSFFADKLPILEGAPPNVAREPMESGTYTKLYQYNLKTRLKSIIGFRLYYRLSLLIPDIPLPVKMIECRAHKSDNPTITLSGLSVRLAEDRRENLEPEFSDPGKIPMHVGNEKLKYSIYVFKRKKKENYAQDEGIVFSINGQSHGFLPKNFFERKKVGMPYLADSILVMLDCSEMSGDEQEDLFMTSRDRISDDAPIRFEIEKKLESIIKNHSGLKELQNRRRDEARRDRIDNQKSVEDFFSDMVKKHPTLANYFSVGNRIQNPFSPKPVQQFEGKKFPTYFDLIKRYPEDSPKDCPINRGFQVKFKTDAENNYFEREHEAGKFTLELDGEVMQDFDPIDLHNGVATLRIKLPSDVKIGEILCFEARVADANPSRVNPFINKFYVRVDKKAEPSPPGPPLPPKKSKLGLPDVILIKEEDWGKEEYKDFNFDRFSALKVRGIGGEDGKYDFYVNVDNIYLKAEIKSDHRTDPAVLEERYKLALVLLGMSILNFENENKEKREYSESQDDSDFSVWERISKLTKAVSPVLIPMISLGSREFGTPEDETLDV